MEIKDKKKLCNKIFWKIFLALLISFCALYVSVATGYYEFEQHKKVVLTNEKIEEFEQDLKAGKKINVKKYLDEKEENYENAFSNAGIAFSNIIEECVENGIQNIFGFLNSVFDD